MRHPAADAPDAEEPEIWGFRYDAPLNKLSDNQLEMLENILHAQNIVTILGIEGETALEFGVGNNKGRLKTAVLTVPQETCLNYETVSLERRDNRVCAVGRIGSTESFTSWVKTLESTQAELDFLEGEYWEI